VIRCPACGGETPENLAACSQCGASYPQRARDASTTNLWLILGLIFAVFAGLFALGIGAVIVSYVHWLKTSPAYPEAVAAAAASAEVGDKLGRPLRAGWFVSGMRREVPNAEYTDLIIPVSGPRGEGKLFAVANRMRDKWVLESVLFSATDPNNGTLIDVTPLPDRSTFDLPGPRTTFLVPLGNMPASLLASLPRYYDRRFGLDVRVLSPVPLDDSVENSGRHQAIAEKLVDVLRSAPEVKADRSAEVIGVTDRDMYIAAYNWRYALAYRTDGQFGVVSTKRMAFRLPFGGDNPAVAAARLRKMITKNIGLLRQLPASKDPTSALYYSVGSAFDLDFMGDDFTGASGTWDSYVMRTDACVSVTRLPDGHPNWFSDCTYDPPADTRVEAFETDLTVGTDEEARTEFNSGEAFPLALVRKYRTGDPQSHAFGIGASHSLDIWLYGDPARYDAADIILADSARIHLVRVSSGTDRNGAVFRVQTMFTTPYEGATMRWNGDGWDLRRNDGWTMSFPDISKARFQQQAALIGLHDARGHAFQIVRDPANGNLTHVKSPWDYALDFEHDSASRITRARDSRGRSIAYSYDEGGRLSSASYSNGETEYYGYDGSNRMTSIADASGKLFLANEYDAAGHLVRQRLGDGRILAYSFDSYSAREGTITFTDSEGYETQFRIANGSYTRSLPTRRQPQARLTSLGAN
jgi:YD repeat-containing protein